MRSQIAPEAVDAVVDLLGRMAAPAGLVEQAETARCLASIGTPHTDLAALILLLRVGRSVEAAARAGGHHTEADAVARWCLDVEMLGDELVRQVPIIIVIPRTAEG